ncbi:MAG: AAA family ATPase, partial [Ectothiorhodospiraceae bacterium]
MNCTQCGRENRSGAAFCDSCGSVLADAPVAGTTFVGRRAELLQLHELLGQTRAGTGRIVLIGGEPGIGKSRLSQECAGRAAELGFLVLRGRCLEDPGAPPYWPWTQLLRGWLENVDDRGAQDIAGPDAALLTDLCPELGRRLPELVPATPVAEPTHARFRLFEAVIRLLQRIARPQPLLLVIDNLHAADRASLRLLEFLAPEVGESALMVLATYRDTAHSLTDPLSSTLSELVGLPQCRRLTLGGLQREETERLLLALCRQQAPPAALTAAIHAHSEGNPLFIRELTQTLSQQGLLHPAAQPPSSDVTVPVPEGIREVLRQRFRTLSAECRALLSSAAVIGRTFELEVLIAVSDAGKVGDVLERLDEALAARLVEELAQPGRYQFSHALVRETLYEELPGTRRMRLHQRIAQQLLALHGGEDTTHLPRLAHHFGQAAPLGSATDAIAYAARAGERADRLLAYEEAVRLYALAVEIQRRYEESDAAHRCQLLLALGTAQYKAGEYVQAMATFREAAANADSRGAAEDLARAALGFEEASFRPGLPGGTACQLLRNAVDAMGGADPRLEARLLSALTRAQIFTGDLDSSAETQGRAVALARQLDDPGILAGALCAGLSARWRPDRLQQRLEAAQEAVTLARQAGDWEVLCNSLSWQLFDLLEAAEMESMRAVLEYHMQTSEELRQPFYRYIAVSFRAVLALMEGRFDASETMAREALALGQRQGLDAVGVFSLQMFSIERERGGLLRVAPLLERFLANAEAGTLWRPGLALLYTELDRMTEARAEFERLAKNGFAAVPRDALWVTCLAYLAEVCAVIGDAARADVLYEHLLPYAGHNVVAGTTVAC